MITIDRQLVRADVARAFAAGAAVERWPEWLPHYRWVRFLERRANGSGPGGGSAGGAGGAGGGVVEMAAWRPFGMFKWPTWWVSEMTVEPDLPRIRYRHVRGVTRGMDVVWDFAARDGGALVTITHTWDGPRWPLIRRPAADFVIGPVFIHGIASLTLAGIARQAEAGMRGSGERP